MPAAGEKFTLIMRWVIQASNRWWWNCQNVAQLYKRSFHEAYEVFWVITKADHWNHCVTLAVALSFFNFWSNGVGNSFQGKLQISK